MQAILLIGIPSSGKTTFYQQRWCDTHLRLCADMLRIPSRLEKLYETAVNTRTQLVLDAPNLRLEDRKRFIEKAHKASYEVFAYYFSPDLPRALARNAARQDGHRLRSSAIEASAGSIQPPSEAEGFDGCFHVHEVLDGFTVDPL
jgi:predicted kinase